MCSSSGGGSGAGSTAGSEALLTSSLASETL